jgi:polyisoprenoid-binding protein YceI
MSARSLPTELLTTGLLATSLVASAPLFVAACSGTSSSAEEDEETSDRPSAPAPEDAEEVVRPSDRRDDDNANDANDANDPAGTDDTNDPTGSGDATDPTTNGGGTTGGDEPAPVDGDNGTAPTPPATPPLLIATSSAADSLLYTLVWRDPSALGNGFAHDHVVRATEWAGTLQFRVGDATSCAVDIDVDSATLLNDEPALRAEVGLDGTLTDSDRETVRGHMLGDGQLEADTFPTLSFTSTTCRGDLDGAGTMQVEGDLTIRDVTRSVVWTVEYEVESDGRMFAQGNLTVAQTDFGITPYSAFFGAVRVADDVDLAFDLVGSPRR